MFEKGQSGNPAGRPKGSVNKNTKELRELITNFLLENFEEMQQGFQQMPPAKKVKVYTDLLKLALPRPKYSDELMLDKLTNEQLDEMLERLKEAAGIYYEKEDG